jgi:NAD-dependent dihydropyrimidine dehydrogenase PreA subunit
MIKKSTKKAKWFPLIDRAKCNQCLACVSFCSNGVYAEKNGQPEVIKPQNCVVGCRGCEKICSAGAISHPSNDVLKKILKEKGICSYGLSCCAK